MTKVFIRAMFLAVLTAILSTAFAGSLTPPPGAVSPTMKSLTEIDSSKPIKSLPFTIDTPGNYKVAGNLTSASSGITISASNVTLDLDGYTLEGTGGSSTNGIFIAETALNVSVKNGRLLSWGDNGLRSNAPDDCDDSDITAMNCTNNGFMVKGATLIRCDAIGNGQSGIVAAPSPGNPIRCQDGSCRNNGGSGISVVVSSAGSSIVEINDMNCDSNGTTGVGSGISLALNNAGAKLIWSPKSNRCSNNASSGISVNVNEVSVFGFNPREIQAASNAVHGIEVIDNGGGGGSGGSMLNIDIQSCRTSNNGGSGISVTNSTPSSRKQQFTATGTFSDGNSVDGIHAILPCTTAGKSSATLKDCHTNMNGQFGGKVSMVSFTMTKRCVSNDNGTFGISGGGLDDDCDGDITIEDCVFSGNTGTGLHISAPVAVCRNVSSSGNTIDGLLLESINATFDKLSCLSNSGCGVVVNSASLKKGWNIKKNVKAFTDSEFSSNGLDGMRIESSNDILTCINVTASGNSARGVGRKGWDGTIKGVSRIVDSQFCSNGAAGLDIDGGDMSIECDNVSASGNTGTGLNLGANKNYVGHVTLIKQRTCDNKMGGMSVHGSGGGTIQSCVADNNTSSGIELNGSYFSLIDNQASINSLNGISVITGTGNQIARNLTSGNHDGILVSSTGNTISENSGAANSSGVLINSVPGNDLAPSSSAALATSPVGNIDY